MSFFSFFISFFASATLILLSSQPAVSQESSSSFVVENWPLQIQEALIDYADQGAQYLQSYLLDYIEDISLLSKNLGSNPFNSTYLGLNARRRIYQNQDIANTWTIADAYEFTANPPSQLISPISINADTNIRFTTLASAGVRLLNMRILAPKKIRELKPISENISEYEETMRSVLTDEQIPKQTPKQMAEQNPKTDTEAEDDIHRDNPEAMPWYQWDITYPPMIRKFHQLLLFPASIPITAERADRLEPGEIFSYSTNGRIQLGASLGWGIVKILGSAANASVGVSFYLLGNYQISVMKESKRWVRVKLTLGASESVGVGAGLAANSMTVLRGFSILNLWSIDETQVSVAPFQFSVGGAASQQFDVYYRYDLQSTIARKAFEKAVLGQFKMSEDLDRAAAETDGRTRPEDLPETIPETLVDPLAERPVQKILRRNLHTKGNSRSYATTLDIAWDNKSSKDHSITHGTIELPDGTHEILKLANQSFKGFNTLWNSDEKTIYRIMVNFDDFKMDKKENDAYSIEIEGSRDDRRSSGDELNQMITEAEVFTGTKDIFPRFPKLFPIAKKPGKYKKAYYGASSFFYGIILYAKQIDAILNSSITDINTALRLTVPIGERFRIRQSIKKAKAEPDIKKKLVFLANAFQHPKKNLVFSTFIRALLKDKPIEYYLLGSNRRFGVINNRGKIISSLDLILGRSRNELFADREGPHFTGDFFSLVGVSLRPVKTDQSILSSRGISDYVLTLNINQIPKSLALKFRRTSKQGRYQELESFLIDNRHGLLKKGQNDFSVAPDAPTELGRTLYQHLKRGNYYTLVAAVSNDKGEWSRTSETRIFIPFNVLTLQNAAESMEENDTEPFNPALHEINKSDFDNFVD